jgi:hypothetical protein
LASVECIILKVLGSPSLWLLDDGFKLLLFIYSLVIIVIFGAQDWISGVYTQPILGSCVGQTSSKIRSFTILEILRMVHKRRIVSSYIYFVEVYFLFDNVDSWRRGVGICFLYLLLWRVLAILLFDLGILACPTEVSHPIIRQGTQAGV